jgi:hypothetical protein
MALAVFKVFFQANALLLVIGVDHGWTIAMIAVGLAIEGVFDERACRFFMNKSRAVFWVAVQFPVAIPTLYS